MTPLDLFLYILAFGAACALVPIVFFMVLTVGVFMLATLLWAIDLIESIINWPIRKLNSLKREAKREAAEGA